MQVSMYAWRVGVICAGVGENAMATKQTIEGKMEINQYWDWLDGFPMQYANNPNGLMRCPVAPWGCRRPETPGHRKRRNRPLHTQQTDADARLNERIAGIETELR